MKIILISLFLAFPFFAEAQQYKITHECSPELMTKRITMSDKNGIVLKEWSNIFTSIYGPSKEDSLFVARIGFNYSYVCLDKMLNVRFSFPLGCNARPFEKGFSIISSGFEKEGAVNRNGAIVFNPEYEFVYTPYDGSIIAGKPFHAGSYYRFVIKNQEGAETGSFLFFYPKYEMDFLDIPTHQTYFSCLIQGDLDFLDTTADSIDSLFVKTQEKHLKGNYLEAIIDYERISQSEGRPLLRYAAQYNLAACLQAAGVDNDNLYSLTNDWIYFKDCASNPDIVHAVSDEKNSFVAKEIPKEWLQSQNELYVSLSLPNAFEFQIFGDEIIEIPRQESSYITNIVAFMKRICKMYNLNKLVMVFPLPPSTPCRSDN